MQSWKSALEAIRQVQTRKGRAHFGRFSIEGIRHVERALRANIQFDFVLIAESLLADQSTRTQSLLKTLAAENILIHPAPDQILLDFANGRKLAKILGLVQLPHPADLQSIIASSPAPLLLTLIDITEPGNVGAMIRTGHGLGIAGCITTGSSDPFHPKAVRTAMGSLFKVPIMQFDSAQSAIVALKKANCHLIASVASNGALLPAQTFESQPTALLMGGEFHGLSAEIAAQCDQRLTIPMQAGIDSFSVSAAAAILMYSIVSQRSA